MGQWISILIGVATLLFGGGLIWRFFFRHPVSHNDQKDIDRNSDKQTSLAVVKTNPYMTKAKIKKGDYREFKWDSSLVKISFLDIVDEEFETIVGEKQTLGAELEVSSGGGLVYGGKCAKESGVNKYKVPPIISNYEEPYSLFFFHTGEKYHRFFRVFVEHINPHSEEVTLNIFFFRT